MRKAIPSALVAGACVLCFSGVSYGEISGPSPAGFVPIAAATKTKNKAAKSNGKPKKANGSKSASATARAPTEPAGAQSKSSPVAAPTPVASPTPAAPQQKPLAPQPKRIVHQDVPLTPSERWLLDALKLELTEVGPLRSWEVRLHNQGPMAVQLFDDVRLLWFEAEVPGRKKPVRCQVPETMRPREASDRARSQLEPGTSFSFYIDPRFLCFEERGHSVLVPGTRIVPHYGWPAATRPVWQSGQRRELRLAQKAPYVAKRRLDDEEGLKELVGQSVSLGSRYAEWSTPAHAPLTADASPLELVITRGADARSASNATVDVAVKNLGDERVRIHLRGERLTFVIWGPDGETRCESDPSIRELDAQNLTTIPKGGQATLTVRLTEFCPSNVFSRAGFYYIGAELPLVSENQPHDVLGRSTEDDPPSTPQRLVTRLPRPLRIHSAELPFRHWEPEDANLVTP